MSICRWCGKELPKYSQHPKTCELNPNREHNLQVLKNNGAETYRKLNNKKKEYTKEHTHTHTLKCKKCGKEYTITVVDSLFEKGKYNHYCSVSCRNSRPISEDAKMRISEGVKKSEKFWEGVIKKNEKYKKIKLEKDLIAKEGWSIKLYKCRVCGKLYCFTPGKKNAPFPTATNNVCCKECSEYLRKHRVEFLSEETRRRLTEAAKKAAAVQAERRRSRNEIAFCNLCEQHFDNVIHNQGIFNGWDADIILQDQKIAILWNGNWHYEEVMPGTSLKMIQNRDKIKINEINKAGYIAYIIKDTKKYNINFYKEKFEEFLEYVKNGDFSEKVVYR